MNNKLFNFDKLVNSKKEKKEISNSITCAKYDYTKKENGKLRFVFANIRILYRRMKL